MVGTVEILGNKDAVQHYLGSGDVQTTIEEGCKELVNLVGNVPHTTDIPIAISYGTEHSNYPGQESETVFAMVNGRNPLFRATVTTEEVELPGEPTDKEIVTTRTLQLVAPRIITMTGALFIPGSTIRDIKIASTFSLGRIEETQDEQGAPVYNTHEDDVFMFDRTLAVGERAIARLIRERVFREGMGDSLETILACREIFAHCDITLQNHRLAMVLSHAMYDATRFADSINTLKQS